MIKFFISISFFSQCLVILLIYSFYFFKRMEINIFLNYYQDDEDSLEETPYEKVHPQ